MFVIYTSLLLLALVVVCAVSPAYFPSNLAFFKVKFMNVTKTAGSGNSVFFRSSKCDMWQRFVVQIVTSGSANKTSANPKISLLLSKK